MTGPTAPSATATTIDKHALRVDLEATHTAYRELVAQISEDKWNAKSGNPAWTCGQLAWHLADGVKFSTGVIGNARKGQQTNPPSFLMPLALKANEFNVRRKSSRATRESVLAGYESSLRDLLQLLDETPPGDFGVRKTNFGQTQTIEEMFRISIEHFAEHAPQVRAVL